MVNIMAFKIHNKYKYFIHFLKNPYLCKTNKQDRTMNNLLTHYDLNDHKFFNKYQIDIMQSETKKYYAKK